jgi:predicted ATPase
MQAVNRSVAEAQSIGHSLSLCYALGQGACPIALLTGDLAHAEFYVALLLDHSRRHGLALWATMGRYFEGMLAVRRGNHEAGAALLQAAVDDLRSAGYSLYHTASLAELAEAFALTGQIDNGLMAIDEALAQANRNDERWCMPELLRIKAELLLLQGGPRACALAEELLQESLVGAGRCEALAWELRSAMSLCRLRFKQNQPGRGRDGLAPVYAKFDESFLTADLRMAKLLLEP